VSGPAWLFFDGLTKNTFSELLTDLCGPYGVVLNSNAFTDEAGSCLGSGYVEMHSRESAELAAKELDGSLLLGHVIHVSLISLD